MLNNLSGDAVNAKKAAGQAKDTLDVIDPPDPEGKPGSGAAAFCGG
jgi:hypothetical protein